MKEIILKHGNRCLVDDNDYEFLNKFKWREQFLNNQIYAISQIEIAGKSSTVSMHRLLLETPKNMQVDHIDHNGLNNQRYNIRNCTIQENHRNRKPMSATGYKGVYEYNGIYLVQICPVRKKNIHIGRFKNLQDAAKAYNDKALEYFGEFAYLNKI